MPLYLANAAFFEADDKHQRDFANLASAKQVHLKTDFRIDFIKDGNPENLTGTYNIGDGDGTLTDHILDHAEYYRLDESHQEQLAGQGDGFQAVENARLDFIAGVLVPVFDKHCEISKMEEHAVSELMGIYEKAKGQPSEGDAPQIAYLESVVDYAGQCRDALNSTGLRHLPEAPAPYNSTPPIELPEEKSEAKQLIQFIDSEYRELFKIPDGDSICVTYPPGDSREPIERACKFLDEMHTQIGSSVYHICEFASRMEAIGAKFEPVNQLRSIDISPPASGEDKFFTYNREEGNTCTGSLHGNFGNDGTRYYANLNERDNGLYNGEIQSELQSVVYALRHDLLKDRDSMLAYCKSHPEAKLSEGKTTYGDEYGVYGFKAETESRQYFVRCYAEGKDSHFAVYAYADKPAPVLEQGQQPPVELNNSISAAAQRKSGPALGADKPSVLDELREARFAAKAPAKPKPERVKGERAKDRKKKDQTEL
jgi:hypothetical protein